MERATEFTMLNRVIPMNKDGYALRSVIVHDLSMTPEELSWTVYKRRKDGWSVYYRHSEKPICQYCGRERCSCTGEENREVYTTEKMVKLVEASLGYVSVRYRNADNDRVRYYPAEDEWTDGEGVPM